MKACKLYTWSNFGDHFCFYVLHDIHVDLKPTKAFTVVDNTRWGHWDMFSTHKMRRCSGLDVISASKHVACPACHLNWNWDKRTELTLETVPERLSDAWIALHILNTTANRKMDMVTRKWVYLASCDWHGLKVPQWERRNDYWSSNLAYPCMSFEAPGCVSKEVWRHWILLFPGLLSMFWSHLRLGALDVTFYEDYVEACWSVSDLKRRYSFGRTLSNDVVLVFSSIS